MKKLVSLVLALCVVFSLMTLSASAEGQSFTIVIPRTALDKSEGIVTKAGPALAEKNTGIHIDYQEVDESTKVDTINLQLAAGELPDAYVSTIGADQIAANLPLFVALDDYLTEENAPHLMAMFAHFPELKEALKQEDGKIYSLPIGDFTNPDNQGEGIAFINKAWVEAIGKQLPTTVDELYDVCKAIKEGDPNGNGVADEIPVSFTQSNWAAHFINFMGPWGFCEWEGGGDGYLQIIDGKAIFAATQDAFRAGLEFWHKMAAEGLLDVEGFTQTTEQFYARLKSHVVAVYRGWTPVSNFGEGEIAEQYVAMPLLTDPNYPDVKSVTPGEVNKFNGNYNGFVVTAACADPAAMVRWFDAQNADVETKMTWKYGEAGLLWEKDEADGKIYTLWPETTEEFTRENMCYTYGCCGGHLPCLILPDELEQNREAGLRISLVNAVKDGFPAQRVPHRNVSAEKLNERNMIYSDLKAYLDSFVADAVVNGIDDAKWEKHLKDVEGYHASEWVQWFQDYLDGNF